MVGIRKTSRGVEIDFSTTMFLHETFLLVKKEKGRELIQQMQEMIEKRDHFSLFHFLLENLGSGIFYEIPKTF
jgi:hypothetical protein